MTGTGTTATTYHLTLKPVKGSSTVVVSTSKNHIDKIRRIFENASNEQQNALVIFFKGSNDDLATKRALERLEYLSSLSLVGHV